MIFVRIKFLFFFSANQFGTLSPLLGVGAGIALTLLLATLAVVYKVRRNSRRAGSGSVPNNGSAGLNNVHHNKTWVPSGKPGQAVVTTLTTGQEEDPDVIPAKHGKRKRFMIIY